jgi:group I intron endonuclease
VGCVYCATNIVNGKKYIGKTIMNLKDRIYAHNYRSKRNEPGHLNSAIRKYGFDNFQWESLYEDIIEINLFNKEKELILGLNTQHPNGYNLTEGGEGTTGAKYNLSELAKTNITTGVLKRPKRKNCTSKFKGVNKGRNRNNWIVRIRFKGQTIRLGQYDSEELAAEVYNQKAKELYGDLVLLNKFEEVENG